MDLEAYELTDPNGRNVPLTHHEFELLAAFVRNRSRVLTREAILEIVAGRDWSPEDRSADVLVGKLRRKLATHPDQPGLIKTVRGVGYKLAATVHFH